MNLLDRYIAAVKHHLPEDTREDVGAELQTLLEDRIEAEGAERGAPLDEADVVRLLKAHGHPYKVAYSYLPVTALIDGGTYALYRRTLSRLLSVWFLVVVIVGLHGVFDQRESWAVFAVPGFWHGVVDTLLALFFVITVIFHSWGAALDRTGLGWRWDPAALPAASSVWIGIPKWRTVTAMVLLVSFVGAITADAYAYDAAEASIAIAPAVVDLLPVLRTVALLMLALNAVHLFQSHWTRTKLYVSAALSTAFAGVLAYAAGMHRVLQLAEHDATSPDWHGTFLAVWPETVLKIVVAGVVLMLLRSAWRRLRQARTVGLPTI